MLQVIGTRSYWDHNLNGPTPDEYVPSGCECHLSRWNMLFRGQNRKETSIPNFNYRNGYLFRLYDNSPGPVLNISQLRGDKYTSRQRLPCFHVRILRLL